MLRLTVDPRWPAAPQVEVAAEWIRRGGIAAIPTDTLYGLAADPFNDDAVARVFAIKGRNAGQAVPLVAADVSQVLEHFGALPDALSRLVERFWPGPLTLLLPVPATVSRLVSAGTDRVGVRVPAHAVTIALCRACGGPLTATSANLSGRPATDDPELVVNALGEMVDVLVDAGRTAGGPPSTVLEVVGGEARLIRAGAIPWQEVKACLDLA